MVTATHIMVRDPQSIHQAHGSIEQGTFDGRWHFSFDEYYDRNFVQFGTLRVFNDDTLSPGAIWPLHPHREIEVVTYCAAGEFLHRDERGQAGILRKGDVQHTTVGRGMWHSEINNLPDQPMRFIQMWFVPWKSDLDPAVQQRSVQQADRTNIMLPLVSNHHPGALPIAANAQVFAGFLQAGRTINQPIRNGRGAYLYVLEGGGIWVNDQPVPALGAAMIVQESNIQIRADRDAELLLVEVGPA